MRPIIRKGSWSFFSVILNSNQERMSYVDNNSTKAKGKPTKDFSADNRI